MTLEWDDRRARICWKTDSEYFVVHYIDLNTASRKFQVFNCEGVLHSTIENNVNILDTPISWRNSKLLITSSIQRFNKHEIIFFERNGLAHGGFVLPFPHGQMKVRDISWNMESTVLCVWSELADETKSAGSEFQSVGRHHSNIRKLNFNFFTTSNDLLYEKKFNCGRWLTTTGI